jgi:hypothetical protein
VFRPVTHSEWETFANSKTANLTRAIAVMLANCKGSEAANTLFEAMCRQTLTYDINPETGQNDLPPRTLLNTSMLNLMLILDRY